LTSRISRRSFLQSAGLLAAAAGFARVFHGPAAPAAPHALQRAGELRLASALPLPLAHVFASYLADWTDDQLDRFDLILAPAYAAAAFIARGRLARLSGPRGRAHDPDGAYTVPFTYRVGMPVSAASVPAEPRLALGAALMRRGYSPNDPHPGRVAQALADLADPRLGAAFGVAVFDPAQAAHLAQPGGSMMLVEYDWVIPAGAARAAEAAAFVARMMPALPPALPGVRLMPLMA